MRRVPQKTPLFPSTNYTEMRLRIAVSLARTAATRYRIPSVRSFPFRSDASLRIQSCPIKTRSVFRNAALLSGLVAQAQLDTAEAQLREEAARGRRRKRAVGRDLANKLVDTGVITRYQADQMLTGRNKLNLGPYLVTDFIGQGGMGQVFKAVHNVMGREYEQKRKEQGNNPD